MWDMRQAMRQAVLDRITPQGYIIVRDEMYYPNVLDGLLQQQGKLQEIAEALDESIDGEIDGLLRCALLWENHKCGLLLHREENRLLCAYHPTMTRQQAETEHEVSLQLAELARRAGDVPIYLDRSIADGAHQLSHLLDYLSEQLDT